ncbi:methyl-accepting chemotaxis protein [Inhella sp.]|uniref:methyl-accepting chemotaxis protein n=1 Tax=Inhella sp. TaxID=1921806 RepID=UPI0035B33DC1
MILNRMRVGQRLGLGFGLMALLLALSLGVAIQRLNRMEAAKQEVLELERRAALAEAWMKNTELNANRALAIAKSGYGEAVVQHFDPLVKATTATISEIQKGIETAVSSERGKALMAEIAERRKGYIAKRNQIFDQLKGGDLEGGQQKIDTEMLPAVQGYVKALEAFVAHQREQAQAATERAAADKAFAQTVLVLMLVVCLAVAFGAGWLITRSVTGPLQAARRNTEAIANGDLTLDVVAEGADELAEMLRSLEQMQRRLRGLVGEIRAGTDGINTASHEIASGSHDLSQRTEQAASNLQQTASSLEEITATARHAADSAAQANQLAGSAAQVARRGGSVVHQVVETMGAINDSSRRIADIIGTIDGIAFQTNILALNAAVEAARAGEQGRGFAVVAGEVRLLAQRSAEAAKEIKTLIGSSVERVEAGSKLVGEAGATMQEIVDSVQRVTDIIGEISAATSEQSSGIGHVNDAVTQLDQVTQQNAALVEQSAAAAESLSEQATRVAASVAVFRT